MKSHHLFTKERIILFVTLSVVLLGGLAFSFRYRFRTDVTLKEDPEPIAIVLKQPAKDKTLPSEKLAVANNPDTQRPTQAQKVHDVEMTISDISFSNGHLFANVCFDQPGTESWQLGPVTLKYANGESSSFAGKVTLNQKGTGDGKPGLQCDALDFRNLPEGADLSTFRLSVESILLEAPAEGQECEVYDSRLEQSNRLEQLGINAKCNPHAGSSVFEIIEKPVGMSDADALTIISQEASGFILGPWTFTVQ